jgi:superfamily II DNA or RNA helicase
MESELENNQTYNWSNPLIDKDEISLEEYMSFYSNRITQDSERLFVTDFLFPLLGTENLKYLVPQYPFLDSEGRNRRIDFVVIKGNEKLALEVNGETYHAEGIIAKEVYDDNLNRQNEILGAGYFLLRYSYSQLLHPIWRKQVGDSLRRIIYKKFPDLLTTTLIKPNNLQEQALQQLDLRRNTGWKKGIVVLPTGTGKTFLAAFDTKKVTGKILFIVHRLDILSQSKEAFEKIYPTENLGLLTGDVKENPMARILFASKDTLSNPDILYKYKADEFDYIIVDEVHHGQADSYKIIFDYFDPNFFMLGLTATPDRMDRKDIFELFDYQKVFEFTLTEAIEKGFLVPYNYYGLKDNIDYSRIKYNGIKYRTEDLNKYLIIDERNEKIFDEFLDKGNGNKAIGFCCSIKHAEAMAAFFNKKGVPSKAIVAETPNREKIIQDFRENKFVVAFTVDLFNEGVDFPDLRVLLFLRPTESKTVFLQQLGRGLRLCGTKENVTVLDFISNYQKANIKRQWISTGKTEFINSNNGRIEKVVYNYSPNCEVHFDAEVEEILDAQDKALRDISKADLESAYYDLAEALERKPTQQEINDQGEFKVAKYLTAYGSWVKFLRDIGEFTEASYHFPQGVHLGHILYILKTLNSGTLKNTHLDPKFVRLRGDFDEIFGTFQRQTKYKLQALMELGLVIDDRKVGADIDLELQLTPKGKEIATILEPLLNNIDLSFKDKSRDAPSWEMNVQPIVFNKELSGFINENSDNGKVIINNFIHMHAVSLMLNYIYRVERKVKINKKTIYENFFKADFVATFCDQNGIDIATEEGAKHRCPFLLNVLEAIGVIKQETSSIEVLQFLMSTQTMQLKYKQTDKEIEAIITKINFNKELLTNEENTLLKEAFGKEFLTGDYQIKDFKTII